jgi:hypothetical protein
MLREFIDYNKRKFFILLKWTSAIFMTITLICFLVGLFFGIKMEWGLSISILFATSIFFPIFLMTLGTLKEYMTFRNSRITLNKYPFNELTKNGFQETYIYEYSKWNYTQLVLTGEYENYPMTCKVSNSIVKMIALADVKNMKSEHRKKLKAEFGWRIEYYWNGIGLTFDTSNKKQPSIDELVNEIGRFIRLLKKENLFPEY